MTTLLQLVLWSSRNRIRRGIRRLRSLRYFVAFVVGAGYFGLLALTMLFDEDKGGVSIRSLPGMELLSASMLLVWITYRWARGVEGRGLAFSRAEADVLLTAPIGRADLIRYGILRSQSGILLSAIFLALFTSGPGLPFPAAALGLWAVFTGLSLQWTAVSILEADARRLGIAFWRRAWLPLGIAALMLGGVVTHLLGAIPPLLAAGTDALSALRIALLDPLPAVILLPTDLLVAPLFAGTSEGWATAFAGALSVLALEYLLLLRLSRIPFEEHAMEVARKREEIIKAVRSGGGMGAVRRAMGKARRKGKRRTASRVRWLRLADRGPAWRALLWKNVTAFRRDAGFRTLRLLPLLVLAGILFTRNLGDDPQEAARALAGAFLILTFAFVYVGPLFVRNDLRLDLRRVEALKTLPVPGWVLVSASVGAGLIVVGLAELILLGAAAFLAGVAFPAQVPWWGAATGLLLVWALALAATLVSLLVHNGLALLLPGWVRPGMQRRGGFEASGQAVLLLVAAVALTSVLLTIPGAIGGLVALVGVTLGPAWYGIGAFVAMALIAGEVVGLVALYGNRWERLDPAEVEMEE